MSMKSDFPLDTDAERNSRDRLLYLYIDRAMATKDINETSYPTSGAEASAAVLTIYRISRMGLGENIPSPYSANVRKCAHS